jgi:hypothetical protein
VCVKEEEALAEEEDVDRSKGDANGVFFFFLGLCVGVSSAAERLKTRAREGLSLSPHLARPHNDAYFLRDDH